MKSPAHNSSSSSSSSDDDDIVVRARARTNRARTKRKLRTKLAALKKHCAALVADGHGEFLLLHVSTEGVVYEFSTPAFRDVSASTPVQNAIQSHCEDTHQHGTVYTEKEKLQFQKCWMAPPSLPARSLV